MKVKGPLAILIMAFIAVVISAGFITSLANSVTGVTQTNSVVNESVTLVNGTAVALTNNQIASWTSLANATATLTQGTNYTVDQSRGEVTSAGPAGAYNATYTYREVGNSTARTLVSLVVLLFALGVFGTVMYYFSPTFKEFVDEKFR